MNSDRVIHFIENYCTQTKAKWAGRKISLIDWQKDILHKVYDPIPRVIQDVGIWLPRRQGKSTFLSAWAIYSLFADNEPGAEVYVVSNTVTQSRNLFDQSRYMVENFPSKLRSQFKIINSQKQIQHPKTYSKMQILSSDSDSLLGTNSSMLIFDEIASYKDRKLFTNLRASQMNRQNPLCVTISTASDNLDGIGYEQYQIACKVRDGFPLPTFLPVVYESPSEKYSWLDEDGWKVANPSLSHTITIDALRKLAEEATTEPRKKNEFMMFNLNRWIGQAEGWLNMDKWRACGTAWNVDILKGKECWVGVDTARCYDITACVLVFPIDNKYYVLPKFYIPADLIREKENKDFFSYSTYVERGLITATPGEVTDYSYIRSDINKLGKIYNIQEIGYDPCGSTELLCHQQLGYEDGFEVVPVKPIPSQMAAASKYFEKLVYENRWMHGNNPVMNWMANNVIVKTDAYGNITPIKENKASSKKIDGIIASIIALSRCTVENTFIGEANIF